MKKRRGEQDHATQLGFNGSNVEIRNKTWISKYSLSEILVMSILQGESYVSSNARVGTRENIINEQKNGAFVAVGESRLIIFACFITGILCFTNAVSVCSTDQKY